MKKQSKTLEELIQELPPDARTEVQDFAAFLLQRKKTSKSKPKFDWAGALRDLRARYTSVELQHEISALRIND